MIDNWRRKIDDSWIDIEKPFIIDGNSYASVMHYYQGSKFKNGFPDFAQQFSLTSDSEISKSITLCLGASSKSGKYKVKNDMVQLRPKAVIIDNDFYQGRNIEERQKGIDAKFDQNETLRNILLKTNKAQLNHFISSTKPPEIANELMKTRYKIYKGSTIFM